MTVAPPRPVQPTPTMTPVPSQLGQRPNAPTIPTRGPAQTPVAPAGSQVPASMSVADLDKFYSQEVSRYRALFKAANVEPQ